MKDYYYMDDEDIKLFNKLLEQTNTIINIYFYLFAFDLKNEKESFSKYLELLKKEIKKEEELYKIIDSKEERSYAFSVRIASISKQRLDFRSDLANIDDIGNNLVTKRIRTRLYNTYLDNLEYLMGSDYDSKNDGSFVSTRASKINYYLYNATFFDIINTYIYLLNRECEKEENNYIKEPLLKNIYDVIASNYLVEDNFIKNGFNFDKDLYLGLQVVRDLFPEAEKCYDEIFNDFVGEGINTSLLTSLILGDHQFSYTLQDKILENICMVNSININSNYNFNALISENIENFKNKNEVNIGKILLNDKSKTKNLGIYKISLKKTN